MRLYLDANAIIYAIEATAPFHTSVVMRIAQAQSTAQGAVVTSRLSRLECRVKPLRDGDINLLNAYEEFFTRRPLQMIDVDRDILERATDIRARYHFKTPDAIHLATAIAERVDAFLTADASLARFSEVKVELLPGATGRS